MADSTVTVQQLKDAYRQFVAERQWEPFHSPKNLSMSLSVEAAELMELFLWMENTESRTVGNDPARRNAVAEEIADVAGHIFCLCNVLGLDLSDIITAKLRKNAQKYPAEQYRGRYQL